MVVQFSVFPVGAKESLAQEVAKVIDIIDKSGLPCKTTAMATLVEGNWDEVMALIKKCHRAMRKCHNRVYTSIVIDDRKGARKRLTGKVESLEKVLRRKIKK
ncbi:MAG: MTH1187 family thiamine-binding protein [FCB group bacterium]|nr:MTH1187 family thiamine-binding protein [FCB group bacterium]